MENDDMVCEVLLAIKDANESQAGIAADIGWIATRLNTPQEYLWPIIEQMMGEECGYIVKQSERYFALTSAGLQHLESCFGGPFNLQNLIRRY